MRAFTPKEQKAIRAASQTMRANPDIDAESALRELQVGERWCRSSTARASLRSFSAL
jgi:hypothetical protein